MKKFCLITHVVMSTLACATTSYAMEPTQFVLPELEVLIPNHQGWDTFTCGVHTICNAYTIAQLVGEGTPITDHAVQQRSAENFPHLDSKLTYLTPGEVAKCARESFGELLNGKNTAILCFDRRYKSTVPSPQLDHRSGIVNEEVSIRLLKNFCAGREDFVHFLVNNCQTRVTNGHWHLISLIQEDGQPRMIMLNSAFVEEDGIPERKISPGTQHAVRYIGGLLQHVTAP